MVTSVLVVPGNQIREKLHVDAGAAGRGGLAEVLARDGSHLRFLNLGNARGGSASVSVDSRMTSVESWGLSFKAYMQRRGVLII